jgi:hypothetical protein
LVSASHAPPTTTTTATINNNNNTQQQQRRAKSEKIKIMSRLAGFPGKKIKIMQRLFIQAPCRRLSTSRRLSSKRVLSSLTEEDLHGQHVLIRADLNVPVNKRSGAIAGVCVCTAERPSLLSPSRLTPTRRPPLSN